MFCSPLCVKSKPNKVNEVDMDIISNQPSDKSLNPILDISLDHPLDISLYKVINLKQTHDLVKESKPLLNLLPEEKGNYWKSIRITNDVHFNCMGKPSSIGFIYEETGVEFECLMETARSILDDNEFYTNPVDDIDNERKFIMEVHITNAETKVVDSGLAIHRDNDRYSNGDVQTLLLYIDVNCVGGELDIYDDHGRHVIKTISPRSKKNKIRCVLLDGNCYHKPRPVLSGKRIMISFQFQTENAYDSKESSDDSEKSDDSDC